MDRVTHNPRIKRMRDGIDSAIRRRREWRRRPRWTPLSARVDSSSRHEPCHAIAGAATSGSGSPNAAAQPRWKAMRCTKRRLSDIVYWHMFDDPTPTRQAAREGTTLTPVWPAEIPAPDPHSS